jgi:hypothetical protein
MSHQCPECWQTCFCHGDIDDICMEDTDEEAMCDHCYGDDDDEFTDEEML